MLLALSTSVFRWSLPCREQYQSITVWLYTPSLPMSTLFHSTLLVLYFNKATVSHAFRMSKPPSQLIRYHSFLAFLLVDMSLIKHVWVIFPRCCFPTVTTNEQRVQIEVACTVIFQGHNQYLRFILFGATTFRNTCYRPWWLHKIPIF